MHGGGGVIIWACFTASESENQVGAGLAVNESNINSFVCQSIQESNIQ